MPPRTNIAFASKTLAQMAETKARKNGLNLSEYLQQLVAHDVAQEFTCKQNTGGKTALPQTKTDE